MRMPRPAMVECWWSARHLDRWLDRGRSAALTPSEVTRLESHLEVCDRCARTAADRARIDAALARIGDQDAPPAASLARLVVLAENVSAQDSSGE